MAGTDTASFVIMDPCQLFATKEWAQLDFESCADGEAINAMVKEAILKKFDIPDPSVVDIIGTRHDGDYTIQQLAALEDERLEDLEHDGPGRPHLHNEPPPGPTDA